MTLPGVTEITYTAKPAYSYTPTYKVTSPTVINYVPKATYSYTPTYNISNPVTVTKIPAATSVIVSKVPSVVTIPTVTLVPNVVATLKAVNVPGFGSTFEVITPKQLSVVVGSDGLVSQSNSYQALRNAGFTTSEISNIHLSKDGITLSNLQSLIGSKASVSSSTASTSSPTMIQDLSSARSAPTQASLPDSPVISESVAASKVSVVTPVVTVQTLSPSTSSFMSPQYDIELLSQSLASKSIPTIPTAAVSPVIKVNEVPYTGSPDWSNKSESGNAPIISQLDYASMIGATSIGKWIVQKAAAPVVKAIISGNTPVDKDDLKYKLEAGEITDKEYYDLIDEYVQASTSNGGQTAPEVFQSIADDITNLANSGGMQVADNLSRAIVSYLTDNGYVTGSSDGSDPSTVHTTSLLDDAIKGFDNYVGTPIKDAVGYIADQTGISSAEDTAITVVDTAVDTAPSPIVPPTPTVAPSPPLVSTTSTTPGTSGHTYPVTDDEKAVAAYEYLNGLHPEQSGDDGNNKLVSKYFWYLVPQMSQYGIDYGTVADSTREYENLFNGGGDLLNQFVTGTERIRVSNGGITKLDQLSLEQQKNVIAGWNKALIKRGVPAPIIALFNSGLSAIHTGNMNNHDISNWMTTGGLSADIQSDIGFMMFQGVSDFVKSPQGMASVGAGLGIISTAGAFMVAGPLGALATMGTLPFSTTEFIQTFGTAAWKTKGELQLVGEYSQDHVYSYNQVYGTTSDAVKNIGISKSASDPSVNLQNIDSARNAIKSLEDTLKSKWVYLEAASVYDDKVRQLEVLKKGFDTNLAMFDTSGNFIAKDLPPVTIKVINADPTWKMYYADLILSADGSGIMGKLTENIVSDFVVKDIAGNVIGSQQIKAELFSGDRVIDVASIVNQTGKYDGVTQIEYFKRTVWVPAGSTLQYGNSVMPTKDYGRFIDLTAIKGHQVDIKITSPTTEPYNAKLFFTGSSWDSITPILKDKFVAGGVVKGKGFAIINGIPEGSNIWVDGEPMPNMGIFGISSDAGQDRTAVITVQTPGYETKYVTVYIKAGETQTVCAQPTKEVYVPYESDSSGGGGGSGGSSGSAAATLIIFGTSLIGCRLWLDADEIAPVIGKSYGATPGYHAFKATKDGYETYEKTVYVMEGKTLEINAVFVATTTTTTTTTPTDDTSSTSTSSSWVVFGSTVVGASVYIDNVLSVVVPGVKYPLPYGYHGIQISMPGKVIWTKNVYLANGDSLTVSPIFEDEVVETTTTTPTATETTKRVYINSSIDGAKIIINGGFIGQWTPAYLDLEPGLYTLKLTKTGYVDQSSYIWIGDTTAFGDTAIALARLAGIEV